MSIAEPICCVVLTDTRYTASADRMTSRNTAAGRAKPRGAALARASGHIVDMHRMVERDRFAGAGQSHAERNETGTTRQHRGIVAEGACRHALRHYTRRAARRVRLCGGNTVAAVARDLAGGEVAVVAHRRSLDDLKAVARRGEGRSEERRVG